MTLQNKLSLFSKVIKHYLYVLLKKYKLFTLQI